MAAEENITLQTGDTIASGLCSLSNPFATVQNLSGTISPCVIKPRTLAIEAVYLQNASEVGGTALAAYPLVRLRAGLVPRLQFTLDLPSEIAQSLPGGGGAYPITRFGYGLTYTVAQSPRAATAIVTNITPPDSRFAPSHRQPRYSFGVTTNVAVTRKWTLGAEASGTSSPREGFNIVFPALDVSAAYSPNHRTQFVTGLGSHIITRHAVAQSFADTAINQVLTPKLIFTVGLGTTFNAVNNTKPHYLASGFTYRP